MDLDIEDLVLPFTSNTPPSRNRKDGKPSKTKNQLLTMAHEIEENNTHSKLSIVTFDVLSMDILPFVGFKDCISSVMRVSKAWFLASMNTNLWRQFFLSEFAEAKPVTAIDAGMPSLGVLRKFAPPKYILFHVTVSPHNGEVALCECSVVWCSVLRSVL